MMENNNQLKPTESIVVGNKVIEKRNSDNSPNVYCTKASDIRQYKLQEHEFELICKGSANSTLTSFVMFIWGLFFSCLLALVTSTFPDKTSKGYIIVVVGVSVTFILGLVLGIFNYYSKSEVSKKIEEIKNREYVIDN